MMAKTPSERFASLKAVADELATILKARPRSPPPRGSRVIIGRAILEKIPDTENGDGGSAS